MTASLLVCGTTSPLGRPLGGNTPAPCCRVSHSVAHQAADREITQTSRRLPTAPPGTRRVIASLVKVQKPPRFSHETTSR